MSLAVRLSMAGDLDMILGNVLLFLERAELEEHDILTYAFGDMNALYLRGQWTVHRNRPEINEIWRRCAHLGSELERELSVKVSALRQGLSTRLLPARALCSPRPRRPPAMGSARPRAHPRRAGGRDRRWASCRRWRVGTRRPPRRPINAGWNGRRASA